MLTKATFSSTIAQGTRRSIHRSLPLFAFASGMFMLLQSPANADDATQKLENFKRAATMSGCQSIPYPELTRRCQDAGFEKWEECERPKFACEEPQKSVRSHEGTLKGIEEGISKSRSRIESFEKEKREIKNDPSKENSLQAAIAEEEKSIRKMEEARVREQEFLKGDTKELKLRLDQGKACVARRDAVQKIFDQSRSEADRETLPEIKSIFDQQLKDKWEKSYKVHEQAKAETERAVTKCEDMLR